jgi:hypothetical protein
MPFWKKEILLGLVTRVHGLILSSNANIDLCRYRPALLWLETVLFNMR